MPTKPNKFLHNPFTKIVMGIIVVAGTYAAAQFLSIKVVLQFSFTKDINNLLIGVVSSLLALTAYVYFFKMLERRHIAEVATNHIAKHLLTGILLGAVLQSLTILVIYLKGGYTVLSINSFSAVLPALAMAFSSAIFEELLFRGVLFRITENALGSYWALGISALIFGALHLANPNSSWDAALGLAIQAGLLLGAAYMYAKSLWLPIAIHFAWNFTQAGIYGATVSGNNISKSVITSKIEGATWYTGGAFGPEGSVQATLFCLAATVVLLFLCNKENKFIKPYWVK